MENLINLLHLEDNPADGELVQAMLAETAVACCITRVQTRDEFENALRNGGLDIILADYTLPMYDGLSAKILQIRPGLPIVLCTGFDIKMNAEQIARHGVHGIVFKPMLRRDMAVAVRNALDGAGR